MSACCSRRDRTAGPARRRTLEVGKYVMDNVYVGLEQGMNGDASGVRVEIELAPNLNLEGVSTPQGSEVGLNWKKDY